MISDKPRILVASDIPDLLEAIVNAYVKNGYDVTTGIHNFKFAACRMDLLHVRWPEELTGWRVPSDRQLTDMERRLDRWMRTARLIVSVNNLYPHGYYRNAQFHRLYTILYERADVIHHFSNASHRLVCEEYPSVSHRNHIVHVGFNYDYILPTSQPDREKIRAEYGAKADDIVFLLLGSFRSHEEVELLKGAFEKAQVGRKRLLWCARYFPPNTMMGRLERYKLEFWRRRHNVICVQEYISDDEIYKPLTAADVVVSVRLNILNSGLPSLGMTFGRYVVAADIGSTPEFFAGTGNALYHPTSADSLARALEKASKADRDEVGTHNRQIAANWTWDGSIGACLSGLRTLSSPATAEPNAQSLPSALEKRANTGCA